MATDLEKARLIVMKSGSFVGSMETMHDNIAKAVAEGIALGRKEGLERAAEIIQKELVCSE
jgi:hypothetical protein